jgi:Protein of unknown function (DUF3005)
MNTSEHNEPQEKQAQHAADSPLKKPETETAHAHPDDVAKAAAQNDSGGTGGSEQRRHDTRHARGIDVADDDTLDDTVDTDGKNLDAKRDEEMLEHEPDAVVGVNATLVNHVSEQGDGLGGFDSRPGRNGLLLALGKGYSVIDRGMVPPPEAGIDEKLRFDGRDPQGHVLRGRRHYALNHMRPSRLIELTGRNK